jgi:integrase
VSNRRKPTPSYLLHRQSGRARAVWTDALGVRQQKLLPGPFDSQESRTAFGALVLELESAPHQAQAPKREELLTGVMLLSYLEHAERHYRGADGQPTSELRECKLVVKALRELYPDLPAAEFGPTKLKAVRQGWVNAKLSRSECNRRTNLVRRIFKWAAAEELVSPAVYHGLTVVVGLQRGRTTAKETAPVGPVDDATVDATLPYLNRHVRGLVEFQRLTGCRPGEACLVRREDIDTGGAVWLYKPATHKTAWRGKARVIAIGPRAQEALREFFTASLTDYLFSPARAVEELHAERSAKRKTPRFPSHMTRNAKKRTANPTRPPDEKYNAASYAHAVARACDKAFLPPTPLAQRDDETHAEWWDRLTDVQRGEVKAWRKAHCWHPNQLRHSFATRVRKGHGLEAAQVLLGHSRADVTQVYAERNEALAAEIAAKIG